MSISDLKRVIATPHAGFYQSVYDADFTDICNSPEDSSISEAQAEYLIEEVIGITWRNVEEHIARDYVAFLNETLAEAFKLEGELLSEAYYTPMTMQNTGDQVNCTIDINLLPPLGELQRIAADDLDVDVDFKALVKQVAKDRLTSSPGFSSFYDPNIARLYELPYVMWDDAYIMCILFAMVAAVSMVDCGATDSYERWSNLCYDLELHTFWAYKGESNGGILEYVHAAFTPQQTAEYDALPEYGE